MTIKILILLVTFAIGVMSASLRNKYQRPARQALSIGVKKLPGRQLSAQVAPFTGGEFHSAFQDHYFSSDGAHLQYGCYEEMSPSRAARALRTQIGIAPVVERVPKLNDEHDPIGIRVVVVNPSEMEPDAASIFWTEGTRLSTISAPSLKYALEFEKWMASSQYRTAHCH